MDTDRHRLLFMRLGSSAESVGQSASIYHGVDTEARRRRDCLKSCFAKRKAWFQATTCYGRKMGVNFGIEYLHASAAISTLGGSASGGKSPVWLHNKASFVKFGSSGTLISNLTKSPLVLPPWWVFLIQYGTTIWIQKILEHWKLIKRREWIACETVCQLTTHKLCGIIRHTKPNEI